MLGLKQFRVFFVVDTAYDQLGYLTGRGKAMTKTKEELEMEILRANADKARAEYDRAREEAAHEKAKTDKTNAEKDQIVTNDRTEIVKTVLATVGVLISAVSLYHSIKGSDSSDSSHTDTRGLLD